MNLVNFMQIFRLIPFLLVIFVFRFFSFIVKYLYLIYIINDLFVIRQWSRRYRNFLMNLLIIFVYYIFNSFLVLFGNCIIIYL
jgi:hypothetical protein